MNFLALWQGKQAILCRFFIASTGKPRWQEQATGQNKEYYNVAVTSAID